MRFRRSSRRPWVTWLVYAIVFAALAPAGRSAGATPLAVHIVTSTANSGPGTLRQAILDANASAGGDVIRFSLAGCSPTCVIQPTVALPVITGGAIEIDGFSQPGASPPTSTWTANILVAIDGELVENNNGLTIVSASNTVKGLAIYGFGWNGIAIAGPDADANEVWGNLIGLTPRGVGSESRMPNKFNGVFIGIGARRNVIGGDILTQRNVISGNELGGVDIHGQETRYNEVIGNLIGLDAAGRDEARNGLDGVRVYGGAGDTYIGVVDDLGERNVISGNGRDGIRIVGELTEGVHIDGNLIGTNLYGSQAIGNVGDGVHVLGGASGAMLGAGHTESIGLISGNKGHGVHVEGGWADVNHHHIGVDTTGSVALPNQDGIRFADASGGIGGSGPGIGNLVSGNRGYGIVLTGTLTTGCFVHLNRIGVDKSGSTAVANGRGGIWATAGANNILIGSSGMRGNLVSGNGRSGIEVSGTDTHDIQIRANTIGTSDDGEEDLGNESAGVWVHDGAYGTEIGGFGDGESNWIAANGYGIVLQGAGSGTQIHANRIGSGVSGPSTAFGNDNEGIRVEGGTIGARFDGNVVTGNGSHGVYFQGARTLANLLIDGSIHGNDGAGIRLEDGAHAGIQPPVIVAYDAVRMQVSGTACAYCTVEVYSDDEDEGRQSLGSSSAGHGGTFTVELSAAPAHLYLTATATDRTLGTSEFSAPVPAAPSTPTPETSATPSPSSTATPTTTEATTATPTASDTATVIATATRSSTATATDEVATSTVTVEPSPTPSQGITPEPSMTSHAPSKSKLYLPLVRSQ